MDFRLKKGVADASESIVQCLWSMVSGMARRRLERFSTVMIGVVMGGKVTAQVSRIQESESRTGKGLAKSHPHTRGRATSPTLR